MVNTVFSALKPVGDDGFTLIELIVVIILIGVLAAVVGPRFFSISTFNDRFFFDDALHGARYARQFAVTKGCYTEFSLTSSRFALNRDSDCNPSSFDFSASVYRPEDNSEIYAADNAPAGTVADTVVFDSAGQAGQISGGKFVVFSGTRTLTIGSRSLQVDGATGFVR